jgi:hypothetical protein
MTYDITIGNAIFGEATGLFFDPTGFQQVFSVVEEIELEEAPYSEWTGKANYCTVSYAYWKHFTKTVGLNDLFWNRDKGLMKRHPGLEPIRPADLEQVQEALVKYRWAGLAAVPGRKDYSFLGRYDMLGSLTWLEWWMNWALENCQWPAIHNE